MIISKVGLIKLTKPLLFDIKRTFTSKSVLISMILLIAVSLLFVNNFLAKGTGNPSNYANTQVLSRYENSGKYHFLAFSTDQFGKPVSGINLQANLTVSALLVSGETNSGQSRNYDSSPIYQSPRVSTNSSGEASFTILVPVNKISEVNSNYSVRLSSGQINGTSVIEGGYVQYYSELPSTSANSTPTLATSSQILPGDVIAVASGSPISTVTDESNVSKDYIQTIWAGVNGSIPNHFSLYYKFINGTEICTTLANGVNCYHTNSANFSSSLSMNQSNMKFLANLTYYRETFPLPTPERNLTLDANVVFSLFDPNGTLVAQVFVWRC